MATILLPSFFPRWQDIQPTGASGRRHAAQLLEVLRA